MIRDNAIMLRDNSPSSVSRQVPTSALKLASRMQNMDMNTQSSIITDDSSRISNNNNTNSGITSSRTSNNVQQQPTVFASVTSRATAGGIGDTNISSLLNEVKMLRSQNDTLIKEKKFWMSRLQDDNLKLVEMFTSLRAMKTRLLTEMDEIQKEKDRLKFLQIDTADKYLNNMVMFDSEISAEKRNNLPNHLKEPAEALHGTLVALYRKCKANQLEIIQYTTRKIKEIENHFLERNDAAVEKSLEGLQNIASSSPCNIFAADAVVSSLPTSIITALLENSKDALQKRIQDTQTIIAAEMSHENSMDMRILKQQNQQLKESLAQMRKRHAVQSAHLRNKVSAKLAESVSSPSSSSSSSIKNVDTRTSYDPAISASKSNESVISNALDALSPTARSIATTCVLNHVKYLFNQHPLASGITDDVKDVAINEIAIQTQALVGPAFMAQMAKSDDGYNESTSYIEQSLSKVLQATSIYTEVSASITMTLTYLYVRLGLNTENNDNTNTSTSVASAVTNSKDFNTYDDDYDNYNTNTNSSSVSTSSPASSVKKSRDSKNGSSLRPSAPPSVEFQSLKISSRTNDSLPRYMQSKSKSSK